MTFIRHLHINGGSVILYHFHRYVIVGNPVQSRHGDGAANSRIFMLHPAEMALHEALYPACDSIHTALNACLSGVLIEEQTTKHVGACAVSCRYEYGCACREHGGAEQRFMLTVASAVNLNDRVDCDCGEDNGFRLNRQMQGRGEYVIRNNVDSLQANVIFHP